MGDTTVNAVSLRYILKDLKITISTITKPWRCKCCALCRDCVPPGRHYTSNPNLPNICSNVPMLHHKSHLINDFTIHSHMTTPLLLLSHSFHLVNRTLWNISSFLREWRGRRALVPYLPFLFKEISFWVLVLTTHASLLQGFIKTSISCFSWRVLRGGRMVDMSVLLFALLYVDRRMWIKCVKSDCLFLHAQSFEMEKRLL